MSDEDTRPAVIDPDDTGWKTLGSSDVSERIARIARQARPVRVPAHLTDGPSIRSYLLDVQEQAASQAATPQEAESAATWRERILQATDEELENTRT